MDLQELVTRGNIIETIVEGKGWRLEEVIAEVVDSGDLDLAGRLLVSAAEVSARQLAQKLIASEAYEPLAIAACFRRQPQRPGGGGSAGGGMARRVFRDVDAEDDAKGVPEYIMAEIEEMASSAASARNSAMARDAQMDRDPIRQYIVDSIAPRMPHSEAAMNAMVAIVRASAWEETRRTAALKVANDPISVARLARNLRTDDIVHVCRMALLTQVAETFCREMGKSFQGYADAKDAEALAFLAEHHPDERFRDSAAQWAEAVKRQSGGPA
jgi:hypothetical protein